MPETITPKTKFVPLCPMVSESDVLPVVIQHKNNDKLRTKTWTQGRQANKIRSAMISIGGKTLDRLRKKLEDKESKQKS